MPIITSYSETDLQSYMVASLGGTGVGLGLTSGSTFQEAVNQTLLVYGGVGDISECADILKLRAIGRVEAWMTAANECAGDYNFTDGNASFQRSQVQDQVIKQLELAEHYAMPYYTQYAVKVCNMNYTDNPYKRLQYDPFFTRRLW